MTTLETAGPTQENTNETTVNGNVDETTKSPETSDGSTNEGTTGNFGTSSEVPVGRQTEKPNPSSAGVLQSS